MARLKQAKEEAEKDIAEFRAHVEAEFQRKVAEVRMLIENLIMILFVAFNDSSSCPFAISSTR